MFKILNDIELVKDLLGYSREELSEQLKVKSITIDRLEDNHNDPSYETLNSFYDFVYSKNIKLNNIKAMLYQEDIIDRKIVFHGAKTLLDGDISCNKSKTNNDFGKGFYCGESFEQAITFVSRFSNPSLYIIAFDDTDLKKCEFKVNQEWMLAIAYFRGRLEKYKEHPIIKKIRQKVEKSDYIYAPIADNRMFEIIDNFIDGIITDEQCKHALAATNLGNQYVFLNDKCMEKLNILERCFICELEKKHYQQIKLSDNIDGENKVKLSLIKYKREGKYIEEILNEERR